MTSVALLSEPCGTYPDATVVTQRDPVQGSVVKQAPRLLQGLARRWHRERRRRKVGRAYDMALEVARVLPRRSRVLDVGCGDGYIAHHLSAFLETRVLGIDLNEAADAPIDFKRFDGRHFPVPDGCFDAALFCYVLHHAQDIDVIMRELRRVLCSGGSVLVYEDIPKCWWDRVVCRMHNLKWSKRTGPCTFRGAEAWRKIFVGNGFEVVREKRLSRSRNLAHPVSRRFYVLRRRNSLECGDLTPLWPAAARRRA